MRDAFYAGMTRGVDSSGIAIVDSKEDVHFHKLPVNGATFVQDRHADKLISAINAPHTVAMAHTRAATVGKIGYGNAHPFYFRETEEGGTVVTREMVGCHNGTLKVSGNNPFGTDSEWALDQIRMHGDNAFSKFDGAYAITWWDSDSADVLHIARNDERTLYVVMLKGGGMLYASEAGMLYWLAERNKLAMDGSVLELLPGYRYDVPIRNPSSYTRTKLPEYVRAVHTPYSNGTTFYKTNMAKVKDLVDAFKKKATTATAPPVSASRTTITADQVATAREYELLGCKGKFHHLQYDKENNCVKGSFTTEHYGVSLDWDAIIPNYGSGPTPPADTEWEVTVLGATDDGVSSGPVVYCSRPRVALALIKNSAIN